jgi:hypothetical protein
MRSKTMQSPVLFSSLNKGKLHSILSALLINS